MTEQGLFPATCQTLLFDFLNKGNNNSKGTEKKRLQNKYYFLCYVYGSSEAPYYRFNLVSRIRKSRIPHIYSKKGNIFLSQGIITERTSEKVILKVQKNIRPNRNSQEIEDSINHLIIKNCPGKVRSSQFWFFRSRLKDGFLNFKSGKSIATAKVVRKYFKSYFKK